MSSCVWLLPHLLRMICLMMELESKDLDFKSKFIISNMLQALIFPLFNPFTQLLNKLRVSKLYKCFIKIQCLSIFNPNMQILWQQSLLGYSYILFFDDFLDSGLCILKLLLMLIMSLEIPFPKSAFSSTFALFLIFAFFFLIFNKDF